MFQRFLSEDHLSVHMKKHDMSLALNLGATPGGLSPMGLCGKQYHIYNKYPHTLKGIDTLPGGDNFIQIVFASLPKRGLL